MKTESIARICHEANRAYCLAIDDTSQLSWDEAPSWQRESSIKGVEFIINNPEIEPSSLHDNWLDVKRIDGWKYGAVKNSDLKEHPCFLPFDELPKEQQLKDLLFFSITKIFI